MKKLLVFTQSNCPSCLRLKQTLAVINECELSYSIYMAEQEIEKFKDFSILNTPTTLLVENNLEIDRFYGSNKSKEEIMDFYNQIS